MRAFLILSSFIFLFPLSAAAWDENPQGVDMGPSECYSCSDGGGSSSSQPSYQGPSEHQLWQGRENARLERKARADNLHGQASAAWDRGDFREALRHFREQQGVIDGPNVRDAIAKAEALVVWSEATHSSERRRAIAMNPGAFTADNLRYVEWLEANEKYQAYQAENERAASQMRSRISSFVESVGKQPMASAVPAVDEPDAFGTRKAKPVLEFGDPDPAPGTNVDPGAQLKSVEKHSRLAGSSGDSRQARRGFDTSGTESGTLVYVKSSAGRPAPAFITNLPESAQNDPRIRQSVTYYEKLDKLKTDTARQIEFVKKEQAGAKGDPTVFEAKLGTLANDLKRHESDQARAKEAMKKRVIDLGFDWNETSPAPAVGLKK